MASADQVLGLIGVVLPSHDLAVAVDGFRLLRTRRTEEAEHVTSPQAGRAEAPTQR